MKTIFKKLTYVILLFSTIHVFGQTEKIEKAIEDALQTDQTKASHLQITIEGKSTLKVNNVEVSLDEIKEIIKKHYQKHTFNSSISLKVDGETLMATISDLKKEIRKIVNTLRNELALKKFKRTYDELTQEQQQVMRKIYPESITRS
jgi:biopolymer transport protein ExbD